MTELIKPLDGTVYFFVVEMKYDLNLVPSNGHRLYDLTRQVSLEHQTACRCHSAEAAVCHVLDLFGRVD